MTALNIFSTAKAIEVVTPAAKKAKKLQAELTGLEMYALLDSTEKAVKTLKETYRSVVEPEMNDVFIIEGTKLGRQPDNFEGTEGKGTASCELRKRSSASGLNEAEQAILAEYKIETEKAVSTPEAFIFNPAYMNDSKLLEKISKAISGIKGIPEDLILMQKEVFKTVVTENSVDQVFSMKDKEVVSKLLPIVSTLALKPKYKDFDLEDALQVLHDQVQEDRLGGENAE